MLQSRIIFQNEIRAIITDEKIYSEQNGYIIEVFNFDLFYYLFALKKRMKKYLLLLIGLFLFTACPMSKDAEKYTAKSVERNYSILTVVDNLSNPWGMTWLPDGSMLITEKSGTLIHFKNGKKIEIENVPEVYD